MTMVRVSTSAPQPTTAEYRSFSASVRGIARISENFVRVTLAGDQFSSFHFAGLDQRVKLIFPMVGAGAESSGVDGLPQPGNDWFTTWRSLPVDRRCPMRTYTARGYRAEAGEIDIDFVVHGDSGPATRWVNRAVVGDRILLVGPDAGTLVERDGPIAGVEFRPRAARRLLLAGDETAAPAICSILETLPSDSDGQVFLEVPSTADVLPVTAPAGMTVTWLPRDLRPGREHGETLCGAVRAWVSEMVARAEPAGSPQGSRNRRSFHEIDVDSQLLWEIPEPESSRQDLYAWIAGEAGSVKELRRFLVREAGIDRSDVAFMGYWRRGRPEN